MKYLKKIEKYIRKEILLDYIKEYMKHYDLFSFDLTPPIRDNISINNEKVYNLLIKIDRQEYNFETEVSLTFKHYRNDKFYFENPNTIIEVWDVSILNKIITQMNNRDKSVFKDFYLAKQEAKKFGF